MRLFEIGITVMLWSAHNTGGSLTCYIWKLTDNEFKAQEKSNASEWHLRYESIRFKLRSQCYVTDNVTQLDCITLSNSYRREQYSNFRWRYCEESVNNQSILTLLNMHHGKFNIC